MSFLLGAVPDSPDPRDFKAERFLEKAGCSPDAAGLEGRKDHRPVLAPVINQRGNSCVGEADCAALDGQARIKGLAPAYGSGIAVYTIARQLAVGPIADLVDSGSAPRNAAKGLARWGLVKRAAWDPADVNEKIAFDVLHDGAARLVTAYHRIEGAIDDVATMMCAALDEGLLPTYVQAVDDRYMNLAAGDIYRGPTGPIVGYHAQCIVGYDLHNTAPVFIVRNSWGADWADGGYALLEVGYVAGAQCRDRWVFDQFSALV